MCVFDDLSLRQRPEFLECNSFDYVVESHANIERRRAVVLDQGMRLPIYLQRESFVSGFILLASTTSEGTYQRLQSGAQSSNIGCAHASGISKTLWMGVETLLIPQLKEKLTLKDLHFLSNRVEIHKKNFNFSKGTLPCKQLRSSYRELHYLVRS